MITKTEKLKIQPKNTGVDALLCLLNADSKCNSALSNADIIDKLLYFDIETTGFSAKNTVCYLIGCVYHKENELHYIQWFADKPEDEILVIWSFFEFAAAFEYLIHFNGEGFDIPYILDKCKLLKMPYTFDNFTSIDLLKSAKCIKELLKLDNHKQKTIETFLGISRDDKYSGGELINVYNELQKLAKNTNAYEKACDLLMLHNHDDICALPQLTDLLGYLCISSNCTITTTTNDTLDYCGEPIKEIIFLLKLPVCVPQPVSYGKEPYYLRISGDTARLRVRLFEGELKHFLPNHKDYYYLPEEDKAIHKSVAFFVDKNFRTQAKAVNCYIKKSGVFLPQNSALETPHFKDNYSDKQTYFELSNQFLESSERMSAYVNDIINNLLPSYRRTVCHKYNPNPCD